MEIKAEYKIQDMSAANVVNLQVQNVLYFWS